MKVKKEKMEQETINLQTVLNWEKQQNKSWDELQQEIYRDSILKGYEKIFSLPVNTKVQLNENKTSH
jgi:hypothetical protein